jgi:hypothetical protein
MRAFLVGLLFIFSFSFAAESFAWTVDEYHKFGFYRDDYRKVPKLDYALDVVNERCETGNNIGFYANNPDYLCRATVSEEAPAQDQGYVSPEYELVGSCEPPNVRDPDTQDCVSPPCEEPDYVDGSGECVSPEEICFTTIESMADECVYIGEDDPDDDVPDGCARDLQSGVEFCISDQPGCYEQGGNTICPTPDAICGVHNGAFKCVQPETEGCGSFNGDRVCFESNGDKVETDSPDHPDNGGNLDGDETNDRYDSRDPVDGGDPENQLDYVPLPTTDGERATEQTAREQNFKLDQIKEALDGVATEDTAKDQLQEAQDSNDSFDEFTSGNVPDPDGPSSTINNAIPGLIDDTGMQAQIDGIGVIPFGSGDLGSVPGSVSDLIPTGSCTAYSANVLGFGTFEIACSDTLLARQIMAWILYVITAVYLFQLLTTPMGSK